MWTVFLFILIIFFVALFFGLALIGFVINRVADFLTNLWYSITGKKPNGRRSYYRQSTSYSTNSSSSNGGYTNASSSSTSEPHHNKKGDKVFTADEGEYVAFEEIKE